MHQGHPTRKAARIGGVVGDKDHGCASLGRKVCDQAQQIGFQRRAKGGKGFIQQQQRSRLQQHTAKRRAAQLPARQVGGLART